MPIPDFIVEMRASDRPAGDVAARRDRRRTTTGRGRDAEEILLVQRADNGAWTPVTGISEPREEPAAAAVA